MNKNLRYWLSVFIVAILVFPATLLLRLAHEVGHIIMAKLLGLNILDLHLSFDIWSEKAWVYVQHGGGLAVAVAGVLCALLVWFVFLIPYFKICFFHSCIHGWFTSTPTLIGKSRVRNPTEAKPSMPPVY